MCMPSKPKAQPVKEVPPPPRDPEPQRQAQNLAENERRRRAAAYGRRATTLTAPLGVNNFGSKSQGVTLLGQAG
ncbi:hypothetical protein [Roseibium sediminis]|uniref:hypothetical protein n=1 Tax=Roseibium sediminis TaxID=1775174 RepID=UPI00123CFBBB|nr:hypothetical protein [Roseibium sediminis]